MDSVFISAPGFKGQEYRDNDVIFICDINYIIGETLGLERWCLGWCDAKLEEKMFVCIICHNQQSTNNPKLFCGSLFLLRLF